MDSEVIEVKRKEEGEKEIGNDEVEREILNEEMRIVIKRMEVKSMKDGMEGKVGRREGEMKRRKIEEIMNVEEKGEMIDIELLSKRERKEVMIKIVEGGRRLEGKILNGVGIEKKVRKFKGVVNMKMKDIRKNVIERRGDEEMRRKSMREGREKIGDKRSIEEMLGNEEG